MAWFGWLPWRFILSRMARSNGFLDPIRLMDRLARLGQPSEVAQPIELLRAGAVLHARGLVNSRVIQHNLDWVWPYWVERQFDPNDEAFVPRAFSITHINLTNRNWTAVGLPDCPELPLVDPRGLVTPFLDGWSLDGFVLAEDGRRLLPSRCPDARQRVGLEPDDLSVATALRHDDLCLEAVVRVVRGVNGPVCRLALEAWSDAPGWLVLSLRPCNPEGISFVNRVELAVDRRSWCVDGRRRVLFDRPADRHHASNYRAGDVLLRLFEREEETAMRCDVGMVTAAAMVRLEAGRQGALRAEVPLDAAKPARVSAPAPVTVPVAAPVSWRSALAGACRLEVPDRRIGFLYDMALRSLVLHSPGDVWPGPFTYRRFWFRDAAFIVNALLCAGLDGRAERQLDRFAGRQTAMGYFHSQDGEWDSNGEALWAYDRWCALTGRPPKPSWREPVLKGARWIARKRLPADAGEGRAGLLPAGFSAEHLGPNDFYYWDDFWGVAGLRAAARMARSWGDGTAADGFGHEADDLMGAIARSLERSARRIGRPAMPAAPDRRLDAGAIGSIVAGYPLMLMAPDDPRLLDTVSFLQEHCFFEDGFFQDMIHSGINAYLTLHVAQVLMRAGDPRAARLMDAVADLATPTGQWPEAIHPRTGGGCMGDGHHVWAAAEWVMVLRNAFVREEGGTLILASGIPEPWLIPGARLSLGPAPTGFGPVHVGIRAEEGGRVAVDCKGDWHGPAPRMEVRLPGRPRRSATAGEAVVASA